MQEYVLGFRFSKDLQSVVLIEKIKPDWQKGLFNGVGGKIEPNEEPIQAMVREFEEETGCETKETEWAHALTFEKEDSFKMFIYASVGDISDCHTMTPEEVYIVSTKELPEKVIPNLKWIIPLLLDPHMALPIEMPFI